MSAPGTCCSSCGATLEVINVPGEEGAQGTAGTNGTNGINAFTVLTADLTIPAVGNNVSITVGTNQWAAVNETVFVSDGLHDGTFLVVSNTGTTGMALQFVGADGDSPPATVIASGGIVTPSGRTRALSAALPTAFTDNTGGTASATLAAGVGIQTVAFYINATSIANGDLLTNYVPGYAFRLVKFDARCATAVTTGAKASDLNLEIGTTNVTGGVISLAGTYAIGAAQAGTTITANNTGTATDSISIEAANTTAFSEGAFWLLLSIQNVDTRNAFASIADSINDILTALA